MKSIFVIGSRGYTKGYGGWETLVKGLVDNWTDGETQFFVFEIVHNQSEESISIIPNGFLVKVFVKSRSSIGMIEYDYKCTRKAIKIIKENKIVKPILYYLGLRIGPYVYAKRKYLKTFGCIILENPAGIEWKRQKFGFFPRLYTKISAVMMAKAVDHLVFDSKAVMNEYDAFIPKLKAKKHYISYGIYEHDDSKNHNIKGLDFLNSHNIRANEYYLDISRLVPENNYEIIIKEFMKSNSKKDLVLITNKEKEYKYYEYLKKKLKFHHDSRIKFIGATYDKDIIDCVRGNSFAYINGHSLGGTNPGLLEALSSAKLVIAYDVVFSREVCEDNALYYNEENNPLSEVINKAELLDLNTKEKMMFQARKSMSKRYSWEFIVSEYQSLFDNIVSYD